MLTLHGYWRSSASYRVRIALNLKGLTYDQATYDLRHKAEKAETYATLNPQKLVPALQTESGAVLTQSLAILEWLEDTHPEPALLPENPTDRAHVRAMCNLIACDIHPVNNLRVLTQLRELGASEDQVSQWIARWIGDGFDALERLIGSGDFCYGDAPTLADCCLVPQVYNARRFKVDLAPWAKIRAIADACDGIRAFYVARPELQPDADS